MPRRRDLRPPSGLCPHRIPAPHHVPAPHPAFGHLLPASGEKETAGRREGNGGTWRRERRDVEKGTAGRGAGNAAVFPLPACGERVPEGWVRGERSRGRGSGDAVAEADHTRLPNAGGAQTSLTACGFLIAAGERELLRSVMPHPAPHPAYGHLLPASGEKETAGRGEGNGGAGRRERWGGEKETAGRGEGNGEARRGERRDAERGTAGRGEGNGGTRRGERRDAERGTAGRGETSAAAFPLPACGERVPEGRVRGERNGGAWRRK